MFWTIVLALIFIFFILPILVVVLFFVLLILLVIISGIVLSPIWIPMVIYEFVKIAYEDPMLKEFKNWVEKIKKNYL